MANAALGRMYGDLDESDLSAKSAAKAWQLRARASDRERFWITASYHTQVTENMAEARQTCEAWAEAYPRDSRPHSFLSGIIEKVTGHYEKAITEARKAIELDPDFAIGYYNLAVNNAYLGRLREAEDPLQRAAARGLEIDEIVMLAYDLAFLKGDQAAMEREAARARARSGAANWISSKEAFSLAYVGHLQQSRVMSRRAGDQAQQAAQLEEGGSVGSRSSRAGGFFR